MQMASPSVQPFLHRWQQSVSILYNRLPLPPSKLPLPMGGSGPQSNTWFPGPTQVLNPNGILFQPFLHGSVVRQTNRPTDHDTQSVTIGCIYIRITCDAAKKSMDFNAVFTVRFYKCSAVAEMGDRLATTDMGRKLGGGGAPFGGSWVPI